MPVCHVAVSVCFSMTALTTGSMLFASAASAVFTSASAKAPPGFAQSSTMFSAGCKLAMIAS